MPPILTSAEVAEIFRVSISTVKGWTMDKKISSIRTPGRGIRFRRQDIEAILSTTYGAPR